MEKIEAIKFRSASWKMNNGFCNKRAMEQGFGMTELAYSLSVAFFVVLVGAQILNVIYQSVKAEKDLHSYAPHIFSVETALAAETTWDYKANLDNSTKTLDAENDRSYQYNLKIKNVGSKVWEKGKVSLETGPYLGSISKMRHSSWLSFCQAAVLEKDIKPGETASLNFYLAPQGNKIGTYQEGFQLVRAGLPIEGSQVRIFVNVMAPKISQVVPAVAVVAPKVETPKPIVEVAKVVEKTSTSTITVSQMATTTKSKADFCAAFSGDKREEYERCLTDINEKDLTNGIISDIKFQTEPIIRVGIVSVKEAQRVTSEDYFDVYAGNQLLLSGLPAGYVVAVSFDAKDKKYTITTGGVTKTSTSTIRFVPKNKNSVMTLLDYKDQPKWNSKINYNRFRNVLEFRYSTSTSKVWAINELPISFYLKGLAETSNNSTVEFQKVLITAAHTYAMYHYNRGLEVSSTIASTKHANEGYHVDATYDQVYKGYSSEVVMPKLSQAVDETKGIVVTYGGKMVITPYFSRSDGKTRNWEEVWGGEAKPWLKSVAVPEDSGQTLWGHGVGMSARGALLMVVDGKKSWTDTLKYFYSGTELTRVYN